MKVFSSSSSSSLCLNYPSSPYPSPTATTPIPFPLDHSKLLTRSNLRRHNKIVKEQDRKRSVQSSAQNVCVNAFSANSSSTSVSSKKTQDVVSTDTNKSLEVLRLYRLCLDINSVGSPGSPSSGIPSELGNLLKSIQTPRSSGSPSLLTYETELIPAEEIGQWGLCMAESQRWGDCLPRPFGSKTELENALRNIGVPPKPSPDISYGYSDWMFTQGDSDLDLLVRSRAQLPDYCFPIRKSPWFPFMVCEWKYKSPIAEGQRQAVRDAAAAVHTLHQTIHLCTGEEPPPEATAAFSLCVGAESAEIRIHWRHVDSGGQVIWHGDILAEDAGLGLLKRAKDVFTLRSTVLNILHWARTTRWEMIKEALHKNRLVTPT